MDILSQQVPSNSNVEDKDEFLLGSSILIFLAYTLYLWTTLIRIKMQVYTPLWVVLICYQVTFLARLVLDSIKVWKALDDNAQDYNDEYVVIILKIVNSFSNRVKWISIFYFILQAQEVYLKLQSTSPSDYS
jgi:phosphatidylserine synthase